MKIIHLNKESLILAFPLLKEATNESIIEELTKYYSFGGITPTIKIENGIITVDINIPKIERELEYNHVLQLCNERQFDRAKLSLIKIIKEEPTNSEYYRTLGQIYFEEGDIDTAINYLIDAIRWDANNKWAYLLLGNIFLTKKDDKETALKYYKHVLTIDNKDFFSLNNIAAIFLRTDRLDEAEKYFMKVLEIEPKHINAYFGLAEVKSKQNKFYEELDVFEKALRICSPSEDYYPVLIKRFIELAQQIAKNNNKFEYVEKFKTYLEKTFNRKILFEYTPNLNVLARMQLAEIHKKEYDSVLYKDKNDVNVPHLIMHELCHLLFILKAREQNNNKLLIAAKKNQEDFFKRVEPLIDSQYTKDEKNRISSMILENLNLLALNGPLDLIIEMYIHKEFKELKANQISSLHRIVMDGIMTVTNPDIINLIPCEFLSIIKIYNLTQGLLLKDLYGIDLISAYKASKTELNTAQTFWLQIKNFNHTLPGDEYQFIREWAKVLNTENLFTLIPDDTYTKEHIESQNDFWMTNHTTASSKEAQLKRFFEEQEKKGLNSTVIKYMIDALVFFKDKSPEQIQHIAIEIAQIGMNGISPDINGYRLNLIPNKEFKGYELLAYYYVSFKIGLPDLFHHLGLPFDTEYDLAQEAIKLDL